MNANGTVFDLASIAVVLSSSTDGVIPTLVRSRFVNQADGFGVSIVAGDDLLATIAKQFFIPLDRLKKSL